jgi:hypothetical protein
LKVPPEIVSLPFKVVVVPPVKVPPLKVKAPVTVTVPAPPVKVPPLWPYAKLNVIAPAPPVNVPAWRVKEVVVPSKAVVPEEGPLSVTLAAFRVTPGR